jgi:ribosomal-protein-alanine N-acetyltransferase
VYRFIPLSEEDARAILDWHYPEPYGFYDPACDPDDAALILDAAYRKRHLRAAHDASGTLCGCLELHPAAGTVEVGLGLRPEDTGRGLGGAFLADALAYARSTLKPRTFRLFVADFNRRAITVYERAGFLAVGRETRHLLGRDWEFVRMERPA